MRNLSSNCYATEPDLYVHNTRACLVVIQLTLWRPAVRICTTFLFFQHASMNIFSRASFLEKNFWILNITAGCTFLNHEFSFDNKKWSFVNDSPSRSTWNSNFRHEDNRVRLSYPAEGKNDKFRCSRRIVTSMHSMHLARRSRCASSLFLVARLREYLSYCRTSEPFAYCFFPGVQVFGSGGASSLG